MTANPTGSRTERAGAAGAQRRGHVSLACWRRAGAHRRGPRGCCCSLGIVTFKKKKKKSLCCSLQRIKGDIKFSGNLNWRTANPAPGPKGNSVRCRGFKKKKMLCAFGPDIQGKKENRPRAASLALRLSSIIGWWALQ